MYPMPVIWSLRATQSAAKIASGDTFTLAGCGAITFSVPIMIGMQGPFEMIVDTGSTTIAVASTQCDSSCSSLSPLYGPVSSAIAPTSASYGDGSSWSGQAYSDAVFMANSSADVTSDSPQASMRIAAIQTSNQFFSSANCFLESSPNQVQGIFGLAFASIATTSTDAAIDKMAINEFTLQLCRSGGNLWVYHYDSTFIAAPFQYTPVIAESWYVVSVSNLTIGTTVVANNVQAIVDSGTTSLVVPQNVFDAFTAQVYASAAFQSAFNSAGNFFSNGYCSSTTFTMQQLNDQLPKWTVGFSNGVELPPISAVDSYLSGYLFDDTQLVYCPGISPQTTNAIILGFSFMNQFTTRFDLINAQIGFAPTARCGESSIAFPFFNVTAWSNCISSSCSGAGTQDSLNSTCVYPNGTIAAEISVCLNQPQSFTRYCNSGSNSCGAALTSRTLAIIVFTVLSFVLLCFFSFMFYQIHVRRSRTRHLSV